MSDSVERVFVHALNTVKKIPRTGSARPPSSDRLKLYGLYKQSMEGDVAGVMARPEGNSEVEQGECEKWDAWSAQHGVSRTEAKRRYISTLITTMHTYASSTPEARALVAELEFVWDQIRINEASSGGTGSDLSNNLDKSRLGSGTHERRRERSRDPDGRQGYGSARGQVIEEQRSGQGRMRVLRPFSEGDDEEAEGGSDKDDDNDDDDNNEDDDDDDHEDDDDDDHEDNFQEAPSSRLPPTYDSLPIHTPTTGRGPSYEVRNRKWRKRMEGALVRMTAEVAALREQIEARRGIWVGGGKVRGRGAWAWLSWLLWAVLKHAVIDAVAVALLIVWGRRKGDRRLEEAVKGMGERVRSVRLLKWRR